MGEKGQAGRARWVGVAFGPALVAAVAYVDPGNVAANLSAGAAYGYTLVWVLVGANLMAMIMQYLSAKLGIVTGQSLAQVVAARLRLTPKGRALRVGYAAQALIMSVATDVAEIIGGAIALTLLFGTPLWLGGLVVGLAAMVILTALRNGTPRPLEWGVTAFLLIIALGFVGMLAWTQPEPSKIVGGLLPVVPETAAWPLIAAMLGATVMPHAIYVHSQLAKEHHETSAHSVKRLLRLQWADVVLALVIAGSVNVALLLIGATALPDPPEDAISYAFSQLHVLFGQSVAMVFALALLASGLGSAIVGAQAGSGIVKDLVGVPLPPLVRRGVTVIGAFLLLLTPLSATELLILSQILLSFGIGFAAIPLVRYTNSREVMGAYANGPVLRIVSILVTAIILALNAVMVWVTFSAAF